jgi:hypothetical protein
MPQPHSSRPLTAAGPSRRSARSTTLPLSHDGANGDGYGIRSA